MADQNLSETSRDEPSDKFKASEKRKRFKWLCSILACAGMLAISLFIFDWYFFSVVDGLLATLQPIAGALRQASGDMKSGSSPRSLDQQRSPDRGASFFARTHSVANAKTPAN
jgi:hypothetical protein